MPQSARFSGVTVKMGATSRDAGEAGSDHPVQGFPLSTGGRCRRTWVKNGAGTS